MKWPWRNIMELVTNRHCVCICAIYVLTHLFICLSIHPSIHLIIYQFWYLSVGLLICCGLTVCLSVCYLGLSIHPSIHPSILIHLPIHPSLHEGATQRFAHAP